MNLYLVKLQGDMYTPYCTAYVVAEDTEAAAAKVINYLNEHKIGFSRDRELNQLP